MDAFLETVKIVATAPIQAVLLALIVYLVYELIKIVNNNTKAMSSLEKSVEQEGTALLSIKKDMSNVKEDMSSMKNELSIHCSKVDRIERTVDDTKQNVNSICFKVDNMGKDIDNMKKNCVMRDELSDYVKRS